MVRVKLDMEKISETLYKALLKEFKKQHGNGYYDEWVIIAEKED